jgi:hypothetical protein
MGRTLARHVVAIAVTAALTVPGGLAAQMTPPDLPVDQSDLVRVDDYPDEGYMELVIGPASLPANGPHLRLPIQLATLPVEGWAHGFEWKMRDAAGNPLPDRLLHHWNMVNPDERELFSPVPLRVLAAGRETSRQAIPRLLGLPIKPGTRWLVISMFANPTDTPYEEAYLHVRVDYTPSESGGLKPSSVYPFYIDVMGPVGDKDFPLPPGRHSRSFDASPAVDGRILGMGAHLHDYGEWIRFEDVTTGKVLWETPPEVDERGGVIGVPSGNFLWRGGIRVYKDHVYRLTVRYMNPLDQPAADGGMGALGGIVVIDSEWPELDRYQEAYAQDLQNMLDKPNEAHGHGHGQMDHGDMEPDPGD